MQKTINSNINEEALQLFAVKLYEKAYNALDVIRLIEEGCFALTQDRRYELLIAFNKIRKEFRNEKLLLMFVMNFTFLDETTSLENMTFI
jgi:hypothetical protein